MPHHAACQCGQLSLDIAADDPEIVVVCNCRQCQHRTGSAFTYGVFFRKADVTVNGQTKDWTREANEGRMLTNHFCPDCGTNLFWSPDLRPDHHGVAAGCLTTPAPAPGAAIFVSEKQDWVEFPGDWKLFQRSVAEG